jgi:acetoacetyl-[acyl-carrier protein] synthase
MSQALPVIVGFGGFNAAGRSSSHQAFRRMILDSLSPIEYQNTITGLACLMKLVRFDGTNYINEKNETLSPSDVVNQYKECVINGTLVRKIEHFDSFNVRENSKIEFPEDAPVTFKIANGNLQKRGSEHWSKEELSDGSIEITARQSGDLLISSSYQLSSKASGQLPKGFKPSDHYNARFHPRGLQMALVGASDAIHSVGISWEKISGKIMPDQVGVYASSVYGQVDGESLGGLLQGRWRGERTTAKQSALSLNSMPADFINAYILGSIGHSEAKTGACASFLYTLQSAVKDIRSGRRRVAIVGNSEAPITPEMSEGFSNMGALASDENLCKLDGSDIPDWKSASRPFAENCGFVLSEASQYIVLMDDSLAIELGADIHGSVPEVFINADGIKKSISAPGIGNYISFAKAVAAAIEIVGKESVQKRSFVHAHGSSTPTNRVTESELINRIAGTFEIENWPVTAVKSYVGHTISAASGDQLISALGTFKYGLVPGIKTTREIANDVHQKHLNFVLDDFQMGADGIDLAFINSKGFGGNNATAIVLSPDKTNEIVLKRHGVGKRKYLQRREKTRASALQYAQRADLGELDVMYKFGEATIDEREVRITKNGISIPGYSQDIKFDFKNPWKDLR